MFHQEQLGCGLVNLTRHTLGLYILECTTTVDLGLGAIFEAALVISFALIHTKRSYLVV
jgi:hypothetical protein